MANDFVTVIVTTNNQANASQLKNFTLQAAQVYTTAIHIRNKMTHMYAGTDFTRLETEFGLPSNQGQAMFDLMNGIVGVLDGTMQNPNFKTLTEKVG